MGDLLNNLVTVLFWLKVVCHDKIMVKSSKGFPLLVEDGKQKKSLGWRIEALASQVCWHVPTESQVFYPIFLRCPQTKIVPSLNS